MTARRYLHRGTAAQPTTPAGVVLASVDGAFSPAAIRTAARAAGSEPVAVVVIARIHGYSLGLPNPGLLPTRKEQEAARNAVSDALRLLRREGARGDGQVATTRSPAKSIARVARARGARHVVVDAPAGGRLRRMVEGDPTRGLRRRLGLRVELTVVPQAGIRRA